MGTRDEAERERDAHVWRLRRELEEVRAALKIAILERTHYQQAVAEVDARVAAVLACRAPPIMVVSPEALDAARDRALEDAALAAEAFIHANGKGSIADNIRALKSDSGAL